MATEFGFPSEPLILAAVQYLKGPAHSLLLEACQELGARCVAYTHAEQQFDPDEIPTLLVSGVSSGVRRLPDDLGHLLNQRFPRLPALLLCDEPLLRPTMSSHGGRLLLVGPPWVRSQLVSRIRMLCTTESSSADASPNTNATQRTLVRCREQRHPQFWVGSVAQGNAPDPLLEHNATQPFTVILSKEQRAQPATLECVSAIFASADSLARKEARLIDALGSEHAAIQLGRGLEDWFVYFPWTDGSLALCSTQRLPSIHDFSNKLADARLTQIPVGGGDLLVATSRASATPKLHTDALLRDGAPALLQTLKSSNTDQPREFSGVVVEVL